MLTYTMDVERRSTWLRSTPSELERRQPFFCTEAGAFYARERFTTERSSKDSYIVFYTLGGAGRVEQTGQVVNLTKSQALLMDCRTPQRYGTAPDRHHWYHLWAHVDGTGVAALGEHLGLPRLQPVELDLHGVRPQFDVILENLADEGRHQEVLVGLAVHQLLANMVVALDKAGTAPQSDAVDEARAYIERYFTEPLTVDDIAREVSLSTSQLIRLFRRQLGTTPHSYLTRYRITRAKELLAETTMPVGEVARATGFSSDSNFSYRFGQMVGQSPSAYRASTPKLFG